MTSAAWALAALPAKARLAVAKPTVGHRIRAEPVKDQHAKEPNAARRPATLRACLRARGRPAARLPALPAPPLLARPAVRQHARPATQRVRAAHVRRPVPAAVRPTLATPAASTRARPAMLRALDTPVPTTCARVRPVKPVRRSTNECRSTNHAGLWYSWMRPATSRVLDEPSLAEVASAIIATLTTEVNESKSEDKAKAEHELALLTQVHAVARGARRKTICRSR